MDTGRILLTRHAEKPDNPLDPKLSPAGLDRAQKLDPYILATFGKPHFLFASAISKHSERPYLTLKPLSKAIDVAIDTTYADQDYAALAHHLLTKDDYRGKLLVVCWHHGHIPFFAKALGAKPGAYPDPWPETVFNLILTFNFASGAPSVAQVAEPF
jgi:broad specificity phosphatase PhoE